MKVIEDILAHGSHRPFPMPMSNWAFYQEWNNALFIHWIVPFEILRECVPSYLSIDRFGGQCYISLVAFTMEKIRPKYLPSFGFISNFDEINVRTYIDNNGKKGVYFLSIEAGKLLSTFISKSISGLPYEYSKINRTNQSYKSVNVKKGFQLIAKFDIGSALTVKTELDRWLTERYCLYLEIDSEYYRYDIHHKEWELKSVAINELIVNYKIGKIDIAVGPDLIHYSEGVKVIAWKRQKIS